MLMKSRFKLSSTFAAVVSAACMIQSGAPLQAAAFTPGNVVIYRVGSGTGSLINTGNPVFLDEYSSTGTLVQSIPLPTTVSGANKRLVASGTATSEGMLTRSADGQYLLLTGYDATPPVVSLAGTASVAVNRVIGRVNAAGTVDTSTALTDFASANNPRSAVSSDGSKFWMSGGNGGVRLAALGATTSTDVSTTVTNLRQLGIAGGQLYVTTSSGTAVRLGTVGTGLPETTGQTITSLTGIPTSGGSPYSFFFADLNAGVAGVDTLYVADDASLALTKYSLVASTWTSNGTVGVDADDYRGLTGVVNAGVVTLYATRKGGSAAAGGGELVTISDSSGHNAAFTGTPALLATAAANTAFRGVAFSPVAVAANPDLTASITAPATANTGANFDYSITVNNVGTANATGVAVNFVLPAGLTFGSATGSNGFSAVNNSGTIQFTGGSINASSSATLNVTVSTNTAATYNAPIGAVTADPSSTVTEINESNNTSTAGTSTVVSMPNTPPSFSLHPANVSIANGAATTLTCLATGSPAPNYQWYRGIAPDTTNPVGTDSTSLTTPSLTVTTSYWVRATNTNGTADSNTAVVTVAPSNNANLSALTLSNGLLSPSFSSAVISYNSYQVAGTTSITVTPTMAHGNATITVNGSPVTSGSPSASITLNEGANSISIVVTAQDGSTTKTYTVNAFRSAAPLATGSIAITAYNADGSDDIAFVALAAIPANSVIHFTDNEWNGSAIGAGGAFNDFGESEFIWVAPAGGIAAGSVVTLNTISATITTNTGTAAISDGTNTGLSTTADAVYAFQGSTHVADVFLAQISTDAASSIVNTGLTLGTTAISLASGSDGAAYSGSRANQTSFAAYGPQVNSIANWNDLGNAGDGTTLLPFDTTAFVLGTASSVTINDVTVTEGNSGTTTMTFTVTRSDNTGAFSVAYATANDTAVDTSDFVAASGTLTFTVGGALTDTIAVTINGDTLSEVGGEQFFVNLSGIVNTVGVASLTDAQGKGTIADDEPIISTPYTHLNRDVLTPNTNTWPSGGITIGTTQFVNLGLQGVGRVPANAIDAATGESLGSISDMQVTDFVKTPTGFSGKFHFLPDRGYNSGVIFSNYAARINAFDFTFTPYTSSSPTAAQNQVAMTFTGSTRFTYDSGAGQKYTTGTLADSTLSLLGTTLPSTAAASTQSDGTVANRLTMDAEGLVLDKRPGKAGSGWVGDEYGAFVYHFNASKQIDGQLRLPDALIPHSPVGTTNFLADPPVNGRRINQGMEGLTQSPDGTRLFALLQSATIQDSGSGNQGRSNTRLLVYDVSSSDAPSDPIAQYVIQLPRIDDTGSTTNGTTVNRNGAQSSIHAISNTRFLVLAREGNGRGAAGKPVFKSVMLADISVATNIDGLYDAEGAAVAPAGVLAPGVTPVAWTESLNMLGGLGATATEVAKFGLNLNAAPGDINSICEKWEAIGLVSANDSANPNDYFLFLGNDNDFITQTGQYMDAAGNIQSYNAGLENDTIVLAYRVRMKGPDNQAPFATNAIPAQSATKDSAFSYTLPADAFTDPEGQSLTLTATRADDSALPAWLTFNASTRSFSGSPTAVDIGNVVVKVTATDSGSPALSYSVNFTIQVAPLSVSPYFPQSVASGDPRSSSVVLWTRLMDGDTAVNRTVTLHVSMTGTLANVGTTAALGGTNIWTGGALTAQAAHDGVVKVKVGSLTADTTYYYQFTYNGQRSPIGRTKTAPAAGSTRTVKYAAINCNDFVGRYFNVLRQLAEREQNTIDFVLNLGDYVYETTGDPSFQTSLPERAMVFSNPAEAINLGSGNYAAQSVGNYRDVYKTIRQDAQLQRVHELFPMISIWDDHEFSDDNWKDNATYFDGKVNEQQTNRKRNGEQAWMEFLPTERGMAGSGNGLEIDSTDLYPNTVIYDAFNFGTNLDLILTDIRTNRADHLIPEDACPSGIPMTEANVIATLAAANGLNVPTFTEAVWPDIRGSFAPYVNIDDPAYAAVKTGFKAIIAASVNSAMAALPAGQTPITTGAAYADANVVGFRDAGFINQAFVAAGQSAPFDAAALAAMPRGLSYYLLGKTSVFSDFGSRYQVVNQTFQLFAGYTYQAFVLSGGTLGRDQAFYNTAQQTFLATALANSTAAGNKWRVVASSTPYTPIKLELGDLPAGITLPTQGTIGALTIPASLPAQFLVEFLLNADEPAGFPQFRQGMIDLFAQHDAIIVSGDIHAELIGRNNATNGQKVVDFTVPSAASSEFRRAVSGAFTTVEGLMTPAVQAATGLSGNFAFDTTQKQAVINATDAIIKHNTSEMFQADTAAHGYTVFTAGASAFNAEYQKINVSEIDNNHYALSSGALDALFQKENFTVTKTGSGPSTDLSLGVPQNNTTIVIGDATISEGNSGSSTLNFTVTRSDLLGAFTVDFATSSGTATSGSDFTAGSGTVTFTAGGSTTQNVSVAITGDTIVEPNETFLVTLSNVVNTAGTAAITDATATGSITNDDPAAFATWLAENGFTGTASGDTDSDGVPDSLEYFFNSSPNSGGDRDNLPTVVMNGNDLEFRFTYLNSTVFPGFLQCSEDLINWANATPGVDYEIITETMNGVETAVRYRIFCNPLPTTQGPFTYLTPFTAAVGRGAIDQLTITNHGMVGAGRLTGEQLDSFGETMGAASGLAISGWSYNSGSGQFSGTFNVLPDRGYNSGTTFSNYAARVHQVPFTFTPYYGAGPVAQTQIVPTYGSTTKFTYLDGLTTKFTTGLNPTGVSTIFGQSVGTVTAANGPAGAQESLISFDAEAIHLFADGSGFVSDEYGTYICRFNSAKQFTRIIQLPSAAQPRRPAGALNFDSVSAPTNGRRNNQGLEGMTVSPDNTRLFALMQSALVQDTGSGAVGRWNTRLFVYDIAGAKLENPELIAEHAVQLPRYDVNGNGSALDATSAQSEIVALSNTQILMLPRDGNGLGKGDTNPPVMKTVDLVDFSAASNILNLYDAEGNQISPAGTLRTTITPARSTVVVNLLSSTDLAKFGFNTNTAAPNAFTVNEKAEGMALVPDTSTASTEDYFLFVANDNDFQSSDVRMVDAAGDLVSYRDARDRGITNDAVFTAWRITICPNNRKFFRIQVNTAP